MQWTGSSGFGDPSYEVGLITDLLHICINFDSEMIFKIHEEK